jgi:hypothetical protein
MKPVPALVAILVLLTAPALARNPDRDWIERSVGQQVFGIKGTPVGRLERYIDVNGTPGVIIAGSPAFNNRTLIVPAEDLGPRARGGLLLQLTDGSIASLPPYQPGRLPVW